MRVGRAGDTRVRALSAGAVVLAGGVLVAVALPGGGGGPGAAAARASADAAALANTAPVVRGDLAAAVAQDGTLTYRTRPDGTPFTAIGRARGTYTALPAPGDAIGCGGVLYRVDDRPVLLLCGAVPAFRALRRGDRGRDVRALNRTLHVRGSAFTDRTRARLARLQRRHGLKATGRLALGAAVVLPEAVRVAKVRAQLGAAARSGAPVLDATSGVLHVRVDLDPSEQGRVRRGDRARITLPGQRTVAGAVTGVGRIAAPDDAGAGGSAGASGAAGAGVTAVPVTLRLLDPRAARGLDRAPVGVEIVTKGVRDALSVPVTALVGRAGGGFAVEVARSATRRDLVAVRVGLFDTAAGRVQVEGPLRAGDRVAVPSL